MLQVLNRVSSLVRCLGKPDFFLSDISQSFKRVFDFPEECVWLYDCHADKEAVMKQTPKLFLLEEHRN